jgi:hypothetical protein
MEGGAGAHDLVQGADGSDRTLVELEHRHLDRYEMRRIFDTEGDWVKRLENVRSRRC